MNTSTLVPTAVRGLEGTEVFRVGQVFRSAPYLANMSDDKAYGRAAGDYNRLHWDVKFAARTRFLRPLVHGLTLVGRLTGFMVQSLTPIIGDRYAIYESQTLRFLAPVYFGDEVEFELEVLDWQPGKHRLVMATRIYKRNHAEATRIIATDGECCVRLFPLADARAEAT